MNTKHYIIACLLLVTALVGCEESYRMEMSIPLVGTPAAQEPQPAADPLDVQIAVEKIVANAGLKPEVANAAESDLFSMVDDTIGSPAANTRTWKDPAYPLYLSMTRNTGEFIVLLNYTPEGKPDSNAVKVYTALKEQLSQLPVKLVTPTNF